MAATAPVCNVTVTVPSARPTSPDGFRQLPPNATLQDVINAFNHNFSAQVQDAEFDRRLANDLSPFTNFRVVSSGKGGQQQSGQRQGGPKGGVRPPGGGGRIPKAMKDEIGKLRFRQQQLSRKKMKVENPKDKEQWVIDDRVTTLTMRDARTGAQWTWVDKTAGKGISAGNEETVNGEG